MTTELTVERTTCRREGIVVDTEQDLIILTYVDYIRLRRELKAAGFDLCYAAQVEQPVRLDWSPHLMRDPEFLRQIAQRRPADPSFRIAAVRLIKKATGFDLTSMP